MVVNEIRSAVIDTINFIIPPFGKVLAGLLVAYYVTYGKFTDLIFYHVTSNVASLNIDAVKAMIDKLYLSSVVPIVFILLLVAIAYLINRLSNFLSSLVPLSMMSTGQLAHHYQTKLLWQFYPDIKRLEDLEYKINDIIDTIKIEKKSPLLEHLEYKNEKKNKEFVYLNFVYFLLTFSTICFWYSKNYLDHELSGGRLFLLLIVLFLTIIIFFARIANSFFEIRNTELWIVEQYLKKDKNFIIDYSENKEIERRIDEQKKYSKKWWWVGISFRITWIKIFKYYRFRFPLQQYYIEWKFRRDRLKKKPYR